MELEIDIELIHYSNTGSLTGPVIVRNKIAISFGTVIFGNSSTSETFTVKGLNLVAPIVVNAPAGFLIGTSISNVTLSAINLVPVAGVVNTTTIYVVFDPSVATAYSDDIDLTSTGAPSRTVSLSGNAVLDIAPTYSPAEIFINQNIPVIGEVGESYSVLLNADYVKNDAGFATLLQIEKNGVLVGSLPGNNSNLQVTDADVYGLAGTDYQAFVDYSAGPLKNYSPSGNVDARPAQIRNVNAPQDAETGFASSLLTILGDYYVFYGLSPIAPGTSDSIRGLPGKTFTSQALANDIIFNTGSSTLYIVVSIPASRGLVSILDITTGIDETANYALSAFNVFDAAFSPVAYKNYILTLGAPYAFNHQHRIKLS